MSEENFQASRYVDFESGNRLDWYYFPKTAESDPRIIGPRGKRIVVACADGSAKIVVGSCIQRKFPVYFSQLRSQS